MNGTTDDRYLEWLAESVDAAGNGNPNRSRWHLLRQLYSKEFVWLVANDDNRIADGKELRNEFVYEQGLGRVDPEWMDLPCSVLEMMVALARRASFETGMAPVKWFHIMLHNLRISIWTDARYDERAAQDVDDILDRFIFRTYNHTGRGGLFPLKHSANDQRKVEVWYQLAEYLLEEYPI